MKLRKEYDSIGKINVPNDKYWGASTQRSKKYFDIGEFGRHYGSRPRTTERHYRRYSRLWYDFCTVSPAVNIGGNVTIYENTFIGSSTTVIQKRIIGKNVVIGGNSFVNKNCSNNFTYFSILFFFII